MTTPTLKTRLGQPDILIAPGVYDGLTASLAEAAGAQALYLSGAAVAYTRLGRPDIGLTSMTEMADTMALIRDRVALPVIIDADNGFGNALNAQRTMRVYERAGASALQVEDQSYPKRCGHLSDKALIATSEMAGKIAAMADARASDETLIIARTDAIAVEGFEAAIERAEAYLAAGADMLFIEAPRSGEELQRICDIFKGRAKLMANMVEGGHTPHHRRPRSRKARLRSRDLPRRHRARVGPHGGAVLCQPDGQRLEPTLRGAHVRFRRAQPAHRHAGSARRGQALRWGGIGHERGFRQP